MLSILIVDVGLFCRRLISELMVKITCLSFIFQSFLLFWGSPHIHIHLCHQQWYSVYPLRMRWIIFKNLNDFNGQLSGDIINLIDIYIPDFNLDLNKSVYMYVRLPKFIEYTGLQKIFFKSCQAIVNCLLYIFYRWFQK